MIVNGVDLCIKYAGKVMWGQQTVKSRSVTNFFDWLDNGAAAIKYKKNQFKDFEIYIDCVVTGNSKEECELICSSLAAEFDSGDIQLDDMSFIYYFDFGTENKTFIRKWQYHYEITIIAHSKKGPKEIIDYTGAQKIINVKGTRKAPVIISLKSDFNLAELEIKGLTEMPILIKNYCAGNLIVINGETGSITENNINILSKCNFWELPYLKVPQTVLELNSVCTVKVEYNPQYL